MRVQDIGIDGWLAEHAGQQVYYHATPTGKLKSVLKDGIVSGKKRLWSNTFGAKLGDTKLVYLFDDLVKAVLWAGKMHWEFKAYPALVAVRGPVHGLQPDDNIDVAPHGFTAPFVPPEQIVGHFVPTVDDVRRAIQLRDAKMSTA